MHGLRICNRKHLIRSGKFYLRTPAIKRQPVLRRVSQVTRQEMMIHLAHRKLRTKSASRVNSFFDRLLLNQAPESFSLRTSLRRTRVFRPEKRGVAVAWESCGHTKQWRNLVRLQFACRSFLFPTAKWFGSQRRDLGWTACQHHRGVNTWKSCGCSYHLGNLAWFNPYKNCHRFPQTPNDKPTQILRILRSDGPTGCRDITHAILSTLRASTSSRPPFWCHRPCRESFKVSRTLKVPHSSVSFLVLDFS